MGPGPEPNDQDIIDCQKIVDRVIRNPAHVKQLNKIFLDFLRKECENREEISNAKLELICVKRGIQQLIADGTRKLNAKLFALGKQTAEVFLKDREIRMKQQIKFDTKINLMKQQLEKETNAKIQWWTEEHDTQRKRIGDEFKDFKKLQQSRIIDANQEMNMNYIRLKDHEQKIFFMKQQLEKETNARIQAITDDYREKKSTNCEMYEDFKQLQKSRIKDANQEILTKIKEDVEKETIAKIQAMIEEYDTQKKKMCDELKDFRKSQQSRIIDENQMMLKNHMHHKDKLTNYVNKNAIDFDECPDCKECVSCMEDVERDKSIRYTNLGNNDDGVRCLCFDCFALVVKSEENICFPSSNDMIPFSLVYELCPGEIDPFHRRVNEKICAKVINDYECKLAKQSDIDKSYEIALNHLNDQTPCCGRVYDFTGCCAIVCRVCREVFCHVCKKSYKMDLLEDIGTNMSADKRAHKCVRDCLVNEKHESHSVYYLTEEGMRTMSSDKKSLKIAALLRGMPSEQVEPLAQRMIDATLLDGVILRNDMGRLVEECRLFKKPQIHEPGPEPEPESCVDNHINRMLREQDIAHQIRMGMLMNLQDEVNEILEDEEIL